MDMISGINKVIIHTDDVTGSGNVTLTSGSMSMTSAPTNNVAEFLVPAIPVPGRNKYTATYGSTAKQFDVGYGEVIDIWLNGKHDDVDETRLKECLDELADQIEDEITPISEKVPFKFGIDSDGNYGYIKDGADTVIPFRSGCRIVKLGSFSNPATKEYDISSMMSQSEYSKLTKSNFFAMITSDASTGVFDAPEGVASVTLRIPKVSYNSSTGKLTVTRATLMSVVLSTTTYMVY